MHVNTYNSAARNIHIDYDDVSSSGGYNSKET